MNKQKILIRLGIGCGAVLLFFVVSYFLSLRSLTINYQNTHDVVIYKTSKLDSGNGLKPKIKIKQSGEKVKLPKGIYTIHYTGNDGYDSRYLEISLVNEKTLNIVPQYSDAKLASLLKSSAADIHAAVSATYPNVSLYTYSGEKLYDKGDWYGAALVYHGSDEFNSDTLRVILHNENGVWVVKTNPPSITFNKFEYTKIPITILRDVNNIN